MVPQENDPQPTDPTTVLKAKDRRRHRRYRVPAQLSILSELATPLPIRDVSLGGISFIAPNSIAIGKLLPADVDFRPMSKLRAKIDLLDSKMFFSDSFLIRGAFRGMSSAIAAVLASSLDEKFAIADRRMTARLAKAEPREGLAGKPAKVAKRRSPIHELRNAVGAFCDLFSETPAPSDFLFHTTIASIHGICAAIAACEKAGISRTDILDIAKDVRDIHSKSPFINRLQSWPRGYPGDFETIGLLLEKRRDPKTIGVAAVLEEYALNTAMAQQHRNKVRHQASAILKCVREFNAKGKKPKILVIACGGSPDLQSIQSDLVHGNFELILNDIEEDALKLSADRLGLIQDRCTFIQGDVFSSLSRLSQRAPFDLILAGGLFDYLTDRQIRYLLSRCIRKLSPAGSILFTNVASGNPYRLWLDYIVNWILYERSEADILSICTGLGLPRKSIRISRDGTGLSLFVEISPHEKFRNVQTPPLILDRKLIA